MSDRAPRRGHLRRLLGWLHVPLPSRPRMPLPGRPRMPLPSRPRVPLRGVHVPLPSRPRVPLRGVRESSRRRGEARRGPRPPRDELADQTAHGHVYLHGLKRAQLSLSVLALIAFGAIFGVLPVALYLRPVDRVHLFGVPLGMWIVVVPMLPAFVVIGWLYARRADALDDAFRELVER